MVPYVNRKTNMTYDNSGGPTYSILYGKECGNCTWTVEWTCSSGYYWELTSFNCTGTCGCSGPTTPPGTTEGVTENITCT